MAPYTAVVGLWALAYCGRMSTPWLPNEGRRKKRQPSSLPPCVVCGLFAKSICGGPPSVLRFGYTPNTTRCVVIAGRKWPRRLSAGLPLSPNLTRLKNTHYHVPRRSFLQRLFFFVVVVPTFLWLFIFWRFLSLSLLIPISERGLFKNYSCGYRGPYLFSLHFVVDSRVAL